MNHVIILAAGSGKRMETDKDKMLLKACNRPLIYYPIMIFNEHQEIDRITIVANKGNIKEINKIIKEYYFRKVSKVVIGGSTRQQSLLNGIEAIGKDLKNKDIVLVHNGDNPLPEIKEISEILKRINSHGACICGHFSQSTVKEVDKEKITKTHPREKIFLAETPQGAFYEIFKKALHKAKNKKQEFTDESMLFELIGQKVAYVKASKNNFKVTTQSDLLKLKMILGEVPEDYRVGIGMDSHLFAKKEKGLTLGGIFIKNELKLEANSDGDVVLHAIFNALSQAIGEMSLGFYADKEFKKGIKDSEKYLEIVLKKIKLQKFEINNLGIMIEGDRPKIDPISSKIKTSLSKILNIPYERIGITATTGEKCTIFGEGLGIQCFAMVSLKISA